MEKISVIVPVYNVEKYLPACMDSILGQTYRNLEIILIDDGSPDKSPAICDAYARQDERVRVIHQKNGGVSAARNAGLDIATGEYITFVDSDDYIDADMYQKMMDTVQKYGCDVVMCDCLKEFGSTSVLYTHEIRPGYYNREQLRQEYYPRLLITPDLEYPATISNWLLLYRNKRGSMETPRYVVGVRDSEDMLFGAEVMLQADSFFYMKGEAFYHYRMNMQSATHTYIPDVWSDYKKLYQRMEQIFRNNAAYDFRKQLDLCLLLFLYKTVVGVAGEAAILRSQRVKQIKTVLHDPAVREMFARCSVWCLEMPLKKKIQTMIYKWNVGIAGLVLYLERKEKL